MTPAQYLKKTKDQRLRDLYQFLRFPSVSARSEHKPDMKACANWLRDHLKKIGFKARVMPTTGAPAVYAEYLVDPELPTVLYYGHYDVQPVEPLNLWKTKPFQPVKKGAYIVARGSSDDKGQVFAQIKGLEAVLKTAGTFPINVKFIIEGEEECASESLAVLVSKNRKLLKADVVVISDTAQFSKKLPAITIGLRGIASAEVFLYGPKGDLHSGSFGGAVGNPVNILCDMVARLHDKDGKITVPGFYTGVKPVSQTLRKQLKRLPFTAAGYKKAIGVAALQGEKGFSTYEQTWVRPTLDVNGITGGYQGEGPKTIIPAMASCKITMRLVPGQDPKDICNKLEKYLKRLAPKSVRLKVDKHGGARAYRVPLNSPWLAAAEEALAGGFGVKPVWMLEGGSIPVVNDFSRLLGVETLLVGFGQSDDNVHAPNERFRLSDFERGCKTASLLPEALAKVGK